MYQSQIKNFEHLSYIDLYPIQLGRAICPPDHTYGPTSRMNYLFHYITQGKGALTLLDQKESFLLSAGQGFLIPPATRASYQADSYVPWSYCWLEFNGAKAANLLNQIGVSAKQPIYQLQHKIAPLQIAGPLMNIIDQDIVTEAFMLGNLYFFFDALIQHSDKSKNRANLPHYSPYLQEVLHFIQLHAHEPISLEHLAAQIPLSPYHLNRIFKHELGMTPHQYLLYYRLNQAKELIMTQPSLSLKQVAQQTGFANQYYFSTCFKRQFGQSPSQWSKSQT